jgi:dCTP deaminase
MLLSDGALIAALKDGTLGIDPEPEPQNIQPASIDVHLGGHILEFVAGGDEIIDPQERQHLTERRRIMHHNGFILMPGEFILGETAETVTIGDSIAVQFTGKSSLARLGLTVHQTAGHCDPGFTGVITLEIQNVNRKPIRLRRGMKIGQLLVYRLDQRALRPYGHPELGSRYFGQSGVTPSRSWL